MHRRVSWISVTVVGLIKLGHASTRSLEKLDDMSTGLGATPQRQGQTYRGTDENGKQCRDLRASAC